MAGLAFVAGAQAQSHCLAPNCLSFPADAGVVDVKKYGARGDGVSDDTQAIRAAIRAADIRSEDAWWKTRIVYFPPGTYLVSNTLDKKGPDGRFQSGMVLMGASRQGTTIRLKDSSAGYQSAAQPKAVIYTSSRLLRGDPRDGNKDYLGKGEGNDAFANYVQNMTIDVGRGNPGAIAVDFLANNAGAMRDVTLLGPSGAIGLSLDRRWPGPALIRNVTVYGFDVGISASHTEYGVTFDNVTIGGARAVSLRNRGNTLAISDMTIDGNATAIQNSNSNGLIAGANLRLTGSPPNTVAIENAGFMTLRNLQLDKPAQVFGNAQPAGTRLEGIYNGNTRTQSATPGWALQPKSPPPVVFDDQPSSWGNVQSYGAKGDGVTDSTQAVLQAMRSGAKTIYFPTGDYVINDQIEIPSTVRRIDGLMSTITVRRYNSVPFWMGSGIFKVSSNRQPLLIERLTFDMMNRGGKLAIEHIGSAALTVRDVVGAGINLVDRTATGGELFMENTSSGTVKLQGPAGAWFRQFNSEAQGTRIVNNGSPLWILGIKTEQNATAVANGAGAVTDVLGGLVYMVYAPRQKGPVFTNHGGKLFASYVESAYHANSFYDVHLLDTTPGAERSVLRNAFVGARGNGRIVPALTAMP